MSQPGSAEVVTSGQRLRELEPALWSLFERDAQATPFQSPAWLLAWVECFAQMGSLRALVLSSGGQSNAFLPLWLDPTPRGPVLKLVGIGVSDYLDLLLDPARGADLVPLVLRELAELSTEEGAAVELSDLRPGSPLLTVSQGFAHRRITVSATCPFLPIDGDLEGYLQDRPARLRRDLRRTDLHLRRVGRVDFRIAKASNVKQFMDMFLDLHAARWREKSQANVLADGATRRFHRLAAPGLMAHDLLELLALCLDDRPVAMAYVLKRRERFMYLTAFDPEVGQVSLGSAIIAESIARAFRAQAPRIDFLRGTEKYKYLFGARDQHTSRVVIEGLRAAEVGCAT